MKRILYIFLFLIPSMTFIHAQEMDAVFINIPDQYIPQLQSEWRKDLVDLYKAGKASTLKNVMEGKSTLKKLTSDYLLLQATDKSTVEMKLLPLINNTKVVCVVTTVYGPIPDSRVDFYTTEWTPLESSALLKPVSADWFIKEGTDRNSIAFQEASAPLDMDLWKYSLSPDDETLTMEYETPQYLDEEMRAKVTPFLKDTPKIYTWEKSHFE